MQFLVVLLSFPGEQGTLLPAPAAACVLPLCRVEPAAFVCSLRGLLGINFMLVGKSVGKTLKRVEIGDGEGDRGCVLK